MEIKVGQVYTFNDCETVDVINSISGDVIYYQIWQIKDLTYIDSNNRKVVWSKALPNNEGTLVDGESMTFKEWETAKEFAKKKYKYLGLMNIDYALNEKWHLVKKKKDGVYRVWSPK